MDKSQLRRVGVVLLTHGGGHLRGDAWEIAIPCGDTGVGGEWGGQAGEKRLDQLVIPRV